MIREAEHGGRRTADTQDESQPIREDTSMLAYTYPLADLFGTMLGFFLLVIWLWLLIIVFSDIFRSRDLGGGAKALWVIFVIVLPFLGIFVYLIARGGKMHERAAKQAAEQQETFDAYVKETAGSGTDSTEQLAKLADLKQQGVITDTEFDSEKAKILA
jgi:hypothetical protein